MDQAQTTTFHEMSTSVAFCRLEQIFKVIQHERLEEEVYGQQAIRILSTASGLYHRFGSTVCILLWIWDVQVYQDYTGEKAWLFIQCSERTDGFVLVVRASHHRDP